MIALNDFDNPDLNLPALTFCLEACIPQILHVPGGYANGFKATSENSRLMVFLNFNLTESKADDYRYPADKWNLWEN